MSGNICLISACCPLTKTMRDELNQIDVCFVVDTTGSMSPFLSAARGALMNAMSQLSAQNDADLRVGLVEFRDHPPQEHSFVTRHYPLTVDLRVIEQAIGKLEASGGGDFPEAVFDGAQEAALLTLWRPHSSRFIMLVGDAPPHGYETSGRTGERARGGRTASTDSPASPACLCGMTLAQTTAAIESQRAVLHALPMSANENTIRSFTSLAQATGGLCAETTQADVVVERIQAMIAAELRHIPEDRAVLSAGTVDTAALSDKLGITRRQAAMSLARLGRRGLLNVSRS